MKPLDADLDQRIAAAIRARGPVEREVLDREFDLCTFLTVVIGIAGLVGHYFFWS